MLISYILMTLLIFSICGEKCDDIRCSNIFSEVCAIAVLIDRTSVKLIFQNICYMRKAACEEESYVEVTQVDEELCNLTRRNPTGDNKEVDARRVSDFSIVGAHQACDHSCPIACTDAYEPACALIWSKDMKKYKDKIMLNHCHIDLFSCATGLNVTIDNVNTCLTSAAKLKLPFVKNMAVMKSLGLIGDTDDRGPQNKRRTNVRPYDDDDQTDFSLKTHLKDVVRRIFEKYHNIN